MVPFWQDIVLLKRKSLNDGGKAVDDRDWKVPVPELPEHKSVPDGRSDNKVGQKGKG